MCEFNVGDKVSEVHQSHEIEATIISLRTVSGIFAVIEFESNGIKKQTELPLYRLKKITASS